MDSQISAINSKDYHPHVMVRKSPPKFNVEQSNPGMLEGITRYDVEVLSGSCSEHLSFQYTCVMLFLFEKVYIQLQCHIRAFEEEK